MKIYVLDASAAIIFLTKSASYERVAALMKKAATGEARVLISAVNWGEALYSLGKTAGLNEAKADLLSLSSLVETIVVDEALAEAAASVRLHDRLGYADCFAAALAMRMEGTLVSTDPDFAKLGRRMKLLALPRYNA